MMKPVPSPLAILVRPRPRNRETAPPFAMVAMVTTRVGPLGNGREAQSVPLARSGGCSRPQAFSVPRRRLGTGTAPAGSASAEALHPHLLAAPERSEPASRVCVGYNARTVLAGALRARRRMGSRPFWFESST